MAIAYTQNNHSMVITLSDDGKFGPESLVQMNTALDVVDADESITYLLITGEAKSFSQGFNLEFLGSSQPDEINTFVADAMDMIGRLLALPVPLVSAVNGHAFGLGAMIVLASDYAAMRNDRGFFCLPEIDLGMNLMPSMAVLVNEKLNGTTLRDVLLTGKRLSGNEAFDAQIVDAACASGELLTTAQQLVAPMLGKQRGALHWLKKGINKPILDAIIAREPNPQFL